MVVGSACKILGPKLGLISPVGVHGGNPRTLLGAPGLLLDLGQHHLLGVVEAGHVRSAAVSALWGGPQLFVALPLAAHEQQQGARRRGVRTQAVSVPKQVALLW